MIQWFRLTVLLLILAAVADMTTTYIGLRLGAVESNPVMASLISHSFWLACVFKLVMTGLIVLATYPMVTSNEIFLKVSGMGSLMIGIGFTTSYVVNNIGVINRI